MDVVHAEHLQHILGSCMCGEGGWPTMRLAVRYSGLSQRSPSFKSQQIFSHVTVTSPNAASKIGLPESRVDTLQHAKPQVCSSLFDFSAETQRPFGWQSASRVTDVQTSHHCPTKLFSSSLLLLHSHDSSKVYCPDLCYVCWPTRSIKVSACRPSHNGEFYTQMEAFVGGQACRSPFDSPR